MSSKIPTNEASFTWQELRQLFGSDNIFGPSGAPESTCTGVSTDTRTLGPRQLFVALRGEHFDAHDFVLRAASQGAAGLVVQRSRVADFGGLIAQVPCICVDDTLGALGRLANFVRRRSKLSVLAIGGSAGKTTTRSVTSCLLQHLRPGRVLSTAGNLNNRVGVPLTLLALRPEHEFAILELGTNQRGEMASLTAVAEPDAGIITLIDLEHTEGLGDLDGVEQEEAALFDALHAAEHVAIGNLDDERVRRRLALSRAGTKIGYGRSESAMCRILSRRLLASDRQEVLLSLGGRRLVIETHLLGEPGALAIAAGLSLAESWFPGEMDGVAATLALRSAGEAGRAVVLRTATGATLIDDSYNSNPRSAERSIETAGELAERSSGRLFLVLGEMRELGALSDDAHRSLGEFAARSRAKGIFGVGELSRPLVDAALRAGKSAEWVPDALGLADTLKEVAQAGDVVLIKASRGVKAERLVKALQGLSKGHSEGAGERSTDA